MPCNAYVTINANGGTSTCNVINPDPSVHAFYLFVNSSSTDLQLDCGVNGGPLAPGFHHDYIDLPANGNVISCDNYLLADVISINNI